MAHRIDQRLRSEGNTPGLSSLDPLLSSLPEQVSGISGPASLPTSIPTSRPTSLPASLPATPPSKPSSHSTPAPIRPKSIPPPPADAGEGRDKHRRRIREYRMRYGLCLYCGDSAHIVDNCHVRRTTETGNADRGKPVPPPPENVGQPREELRRQVREYRQRYHLCKYCGIAGHELDDCPDRPLRSQSRNPEDREKEVEKEKDSTAEIVHKIQAVLGNMAVGPGKRGNEGRRSKSSSEDKKSDGKESDD
ncbi:hypothetical protein L202_05432 [Cryptococcus amylolentus CBS 6039]|uniref:CCHC-type domain-containing protein n=1 Tax=Cryptococcus amylolentus CBS 6039 TaxID=1295533 RepID=A0A1E3HKG9_9TREE|nr:hypothetical protein L202_05432 [Cryptococcus amylolentus CBS 6039]ODN76838.1 hypothetical protein L202_05432 [Cryptococcus amylolentus CBS 6039]